MVIVPAQLQSYTTFGSLLRYLRKRARLTQRELGIATGYSEAQISRIETNQRPPDPDSLLPLFVPTLLIENDPDTVARLLDLAQLANSVPNEILPLPASEYQPPTPVPTAGPAASRLPAPLTSFIGREAEVAAILALLTGNQARLTTLTGSGGVGKTRLAIQTAVTAASYFPDGVWFIDLTPISDPCLVARVVASTLLYSEPAGSNLEDFLLRFLREKHALLLLDNCEHLVEECARLAGLLLTNCPGLQIMATSREALNIPGERLYRVPSLPVPDPQHLPPTNHLPGYAAVRLFVERAQAIQPAFTLNETNALAVVSICTRLDGIPLALEMAAARVGLLTVEEIDRRLDQAFRLLTGGSRTALPRHRTLRAAIQWSYDLLSEAEQQLLRRLAVFVSGCTLEAAEAVCSQEQPLAEEVLSLLASLVSKSIVISDQRPGRETRFQLLETVRQFGLEQLEAMGEEACLRDRHLDYFLALAEKGEAGLRGSARPEWKRRLLADLENLSAAIDWGYHGKPDVEKGLRIAAALSFRFIRTIGQGHLGYKWLVNGIELIKLQSIPDQLQALLLYIMADGWHNTPGIEIEKLDWYYEECVALCRKIGSPADPILALALTSWSQPIYLRRSRPELDARRRMEGVEIARRLVADDPWFAAFAFHGAAVLLPIYPDQYDLAYELSEEANRLFLACGDRWSCKPLQTMAYVEAARGHLDRALALLEEQARLIEDEDMTGEFFRSSIYAWVLIQKQDYVSRL
jgi:predicted ATPase/transcriptional regulator with XRE-family HTH domain